MKANKAFKLVLLLGLLYVLQQYALGIYLRPTLLKLLRSACGAKAWFFAARVDVVLGRVTLDGVRADGFLLTQKLRAGAVVIKARHADIIKKQIHIERMNLRGPTLEYDLGGQSSFRFGPPETLGRPYRIDAVTVTDGEVVFYDRLVDDFKFVIDDVSGELKNLNNLSTLVEEPAVVELEGEAAGGGNCLLKGTFNPLFPGAYFHALVHLDSCPLPTFRPYGREAYFERGWMDFKMNAVGKNYNYHTVNEAMLRDILIKEKGFKLRQLIGLSAEDISAQLSKEKGGFSIVCATDGDMRQGLPTVFYKLVDAMDAECSQVFKAEAGATLKRRLKGLLF